MCFIKNPYKTHTGTRKQLISRYDKQRYGTAEKNPVSVDIQGIQDSKLQQPTTSENSLYLIGKDEVPSSNLGNSSKKACNPKA